MSLDVKGLQSIVVVFLLGTILLSKPVLSFAQVFETEHGEAQVVSESTLENFTGKSDYLVGQINLADSTVGFYLDLSTLGTGVELRDEHMQEEFLETDEYPFAQFSGKLFSPFDPTSADTQDIKVRGEFKLHGITRTVEVNGKMARKNNHLFVHADWQLQLPDYNIKIPKVLFLKVSKTQQLSVTAILDEKAGSG